MALVTIEIPTGKRRVPAPNGLRLVRKKKWLTEDDYINAKYLSILMIMMARM